MSEPNDGSAAYEALPECVRMTLTLKEFNWLSDAEKARLIETETEPEFD